jgi:hypothetical protein
LTLLFFKKIKRLSLKRNLKNVFLLLLILYLIISPPSLYASKEVNKGSEKKPFIVPRISSEVEIDGYLDEEIWGKAVKIDANIEVSPGENIPAPVKTEVLIVYDNLNIYVAFKALDPDPSQIRATFCDRDAIWDNDWVLILFDTFNDERRCYDFACNPIGIQADIVESVSGGGGSWDAIWESDGRITEEGYIVEMAIPFSALKFPRREGEQIWGFDAVRSYPRNVRHHIGSFPRDRNNNCYFCQLEKLAGFIDVEPGRDIELNPTFTSIIEQKNGDSGSFETEPSNEPGLTSSWGITNNLKLTATLNPDFSTIESDVIQVDINNPFALWYPEKRPFFIEGEDFFETKIDAIYTRTLADPNLGVKLTGKEGKNTIGFFSVQDAITNFVFPSLESSDSDSMEVKSYGSVFRYLRDFGQSSNVGLLLTDREGTNYHNRVLGADGILRLGKRDHLRWQFLGSRTLYPDSIALRNTQPTEEFGGKGIEIDYSHSTSNYYISGTYEEKSPTFRTDLGSVNQTGYRYIDLGGNYIWRAGPGHWFTWLSLYTGADIGKDYYGHTARKEIKANIDYNGPFQSYAGIYGKISQDRYEQEIFNTSLLNYWIGGQPIKWFGFNLWSVFGKQIDYDNVRQGTGLQLGASTSFKIGPRLSLSLDHYYENLYVDGGKLYSANREYIKLMYHFNKRLFIRTIFQYAVYQKTPDLYNDYVESEEKEFLSQILLSYKINPHTAFYLGYSDKHYGNTNTDMEQTNRNFFAKIGYAWML